MREDSKRGTTLHRMPRHRSDTRAGGTGRTSAAARPAAARLAVLPLFLVLAAFEIAWLLLLAYAAHRFLLQPILEY